VPELPEVETTRRGIEPLLRHRRVVAVTLRDPRLRWPVVLPGDLVGQRFQEVARRGKYLLVRLDRGHLMIHLGMSGSLRVVSGQLDFLKHDHLALSLDDGRSLRLHDPRRFGSVHWLAHEPPHGWPREGPPGLANGGHQDVPVALPRHWLLDGLGVEPLSEAFDGRYLRAQARGRRLAIKQLLMDSRVVVGVGNIYANEALFLAGIRPRLAAGRLHRPALEALASAVKQVLGAAIRQGGTTLRDFVNQDGNPGYFKQSLFVYGREGLPCRLCATPLKGLRLGQRATVYCPKCQSGQGFRQP